MIVFELAHDFLVIAFAALFSGLSIGDWVAVFVEVLHTHHGFSIHVVLMGNCWFLNFIFIHLVSPSICGAFSLGFRLS